MNKELSVREKNINLLIRLAGVLVLLCIICVAVLFANPFRFLFPSEPISDQMKSLTLEQDQIEFFYPANWYAYVSPQGYHGDKEIIAVITAPIPNFQNINVAHKYFVSNDISEVTDWGASRIKTRFVRNELNPITPYVSELVSGSIREYKVYTGSTIGTQNVYCKDLYFLHEQNGYIFSFCTYESDWAKVSPIFNKIIANIQFLEK